MAKLTKRTKKFMKNKLDQTLKQRQDAKKKQKYTQNKGKRVKDEPTEEKEEEPEVVESQAPAMSVDDFLSGGFREGMEGEDEDFQFYACCSFRPEGSTCRNMLETLVGESGTSQGHLAREV